MIKIIAANSQIEAMFSDRKVKKDGKAFCIFCEKSRQILEHGAKPQEVYKRFHSETSFRLSPSLFEEARDYFHANFNHREDLVSVFDDDGNVVGYLYWVRNRLRDNSIYPGIPAEDFWDYDFKGRPVNDFVLNWARCYVFSQLEEYTYAIARYILDKFPDRIVYFNDYMAELAIWGKAQERVKVIGSFYDLPENYRRNCMQIITSEYNAYSDHAPESKNLIYNSVNIMYSMLWGSHISHPGCKYPDKVVVRIDNKFASVGLVDIIKVTMNIAYQAKMQGYVPVADLSQEGCCQYWEPGVNVWEELFRPLSDIRPEETEACANLISARKEERGWLVRDWRSNPMWREADYRALAQGEWEGQPYLSSKAWDFVKRHAPVPLQGRINDLAAAEEKEKAFALNQDDMHILGVIIRGTDYRKEIGISNEKNASNASVEQMLGWCKDLMAIGRYDYLFLATEDEDYFRSFKESFPVDKLLYVDQPRVHMDLSMGQHITTDVLFKEKEAAGLELAKLYLTAMKCLVVCDDIISSMDNGTYRQVLRWNAGRYSLAKIVKDEEALPVSAKVAANKNGITTENKVEASKREVIKGEPPMKMNVASVVTANYQSLLSDRRRAWWVEGNLPHLKKPELLRKGDFFITSSETMCGSFVYGAPVCRPEALQNFEEKPVVLLLLDDDSRARKILLSYGYVEGGDFYGWDDTDISEAKEGKTTEVQGEKRQRASPYDEYLRRYGQVTELDRMEMAKDIASFASNPLISIIMPVYNPQEKFFRQALDSVLAQVYTRWELCIADDASSEPYVKKVIEEYRQKDARIKVIYRKENGHICKAENSALELASGEFTALMDHDDILYPEALYCIAKEINTSSGAVDMIYTDMDYVDGEGHRSNPRFGGDFDPVIFASWNNVAHLEVYRTQILKEIGGFRPGYEGSQDYDLTWRFFKHTDIGRIHHIPHICYSWRRFAGYATVSAAAGLSKAQDAAFRAVKDFYADDDSMEVVKLVNIQAKPKLPVPAPMVSVIIGNEDVDVLRECLDSFFSLTDYSNYEIIVIDTGSEEQELKNCLGEMYKRANVHVHKFDEASNHSAICNFGADKARGDSFLFLNCGLKIIEPGWLTSMVRELSRNRVGVVGAKILCEDGKIQHAGIALRGPMIAHNPGAGMMGKAAGYRNILKMTRQCAAVTGQCLLIRRETFEAVRGWDDDFPGIYGDIDLCLRAREKGWHVVFDAQAVLYNTGHISRINYRNESKHKVKSDMARRAGSLIIQRHAKELFSDPFYNPNLTWQEPDYSIAKFPAASKPWRSWIEVVCPVSPGGILMGVQIANHAYRHGVKLRLHVLAEYMPWLSDFRLPFSVRPMLIPASPDSEREIVYDKVLEQVSVLPDSSGLIVGAVPTKTSEQDCKLNMAEYLLCQLRLPVREKVMPLLPEARELDEKTKSVLVGKTALLCVDGESSDNVMSKDVAIRILKILHEAGFRVVQIGNLKSECISGCEGYVLEMGTVGFWRSVFDEAELVVSTDSWVTHLANILSLPRIIVLSETGCQDYYSNLYLKEKEEYLIIKSNEMCEEEVERFVI
ncbi:glycosyltransferase [Selenomonas sp. AB3002]|uniref:glycosyltransferase family 2 protein n=1 Tax=Selenomonas sp. AB3002 TaxID=1392502 RepID=UPI00068EE477